MKKIFLLFAVCLCLHSQAQLEKGSRIIGLQTNLIIGDIYNTLPELSISSTNKTYGLNLVPTMGWAVDRNWVVGGQATLGFSHEEYSPPYPGAGTNIYNYYDFGIAPFTRLYLDITKNKKWKGYGLAAIEFANMQRFYTNRNLGGSSKSSDSYTYVKATVGIGFGYFGRKVAVDLNAAVTGLRLGVYKTFGGQKK
jgi:hypothetical protein